MDFSFTEEQQMLRDGLGRYLEKSHDFDARQRIVRGEEPWSRDAWAQYSEFGLLMLPFAEEQGGLGGSISDCVAVSELLGKHLTVEPWSHAIMLAAAALAASEGDEAAGLLERVMAGEGIVAFAYEEGAGTPSLDHVAMVATPSGGDYRLRGEKRLVIAGAEADALVVVARGGEGGPLALFLVEGRADGLEARSYLTIDGLSAANIRFEGTKASLLRSDVSKTLTRILSSAITVQCAESVGAMGALLALTGEYAATRKQFGVPIASFQAVAHRLADMKIAYTKARATTIYTTALVESGAASARDIAVMKGQVGKLGRALGEAAIQTHGGVGMTDELSVSHYHKRILALDAQLGTSEFHLRTLGRP
ncbi:MAG: acyl-CoA dehydrogenase family protein [Erythrobacter sp.]